MEARVAELKTTNEMMKRELAAKHDELERSKERTMTALADLETKRREADELHVALSNSYVFSIILMNFLYVKIG